MDINELFSNSLLIGVWLFYTIMWILLPIFVYRINKKLNTVIELLKEDSHYSKVMVQLLRGLLTEKMKENE